MLRIFSWNINGIRAVLKKGALQFFLDEYRPDILCLQEIKARPEQVEHDFGEYKVFWNPATRPGYSGTAILVSSTLDTSVFNVMRWTREEAALLEKTAEAAPNAQLLQTSMDFVHTKDPETNSHEGRVQILESPKFYLVNVYTPNSKPDLSRLELRYKNWDPQFLELLKELEQTKPVITCGDFNAAHTEIDLARPAANHHNAGFTNEERQGISNLVDVGFIDTFRTLHPDTKRYTWWSHWGHARDNNVGWRIDYFLISDSLKNRLKDAEIYENVLGSDHCPISISLDINGLGKAEVSAS